MKILKWYSAIAVTYTTIACFVDGFSSEFASVRSMDL